LSLSAFRTFGRCRHRVALWRPYRNFMSRLPGTLLAEEGVLEMTTPKGGTQKIAGKAGDVAWMDSGHHSAVNKGKSDIHALVIEIKGSPQKLAK
jgi:hypothetical protein